MMITLLLTWLTFFNLTGNTASPLPSFCVPICKHCFNHLWNTLSALLSLSDKHSASIARYQCQTLYSDRLALFDEYVRYLYVMKEGADLKCFAICCPETI